MVEAPIKVLLIDDHRPFFTLTRALLQTSRLRADVDWVDTYGGGLDEMLRSRHDVYLVDYYLGEGIGTDIVRQARRCGNDAPMIVLTGRTDDEIDLEALEAGATDYIPKGRMDGRSLERSIRYALERKRMTDALRESNDRYRHIVETSQEGIIVIDDQHRTTFANQRMAQLLGTSLDELMSRSITEFTDDGGRRMLRTKLALRRMGLAEQYDFRFVRADGASIWAIVSANPIRDNRGSFMGTLAMVTDITARHRAEDALMEANDRLEQRVRERTVELREALEQLEKSHDSQRQFFVDASHDLRTPLTVILAELDLLRRRRELSLEVSDSLGQIATQVRRLDLLANDLLLLARIESGANEGELRIARLDELLLQCIESLSSMAKEKGIAWQIVIEEPVELRCQPHAVERAIYNVLENAIKYSHEEGTIRVALEAGTKEARIVISDNGPGITAADVPRVFDRFYRGNSVRNVKGSGLGLSIVKAIVEAHGGDVTLESEPASGTTVRIAIPC